MSLHVIVGAGAPARATANLLAESGEDVRVISRRGAGPRHERIERVSADATETAKLTELCDGASTVYNATAAPYHRWPTDLPPLFRSILAAAENARADYVMLGNLYGYGPHEGPITPDTPLAATGPKGRTRARLWHNAKAAHDAGRLWVTEVRAAQFLGMGAVSVFDVMAAPRIRAGQLALVPQHADTPHAYSFIGDVARTLVAAAGDDRAWGRAWHAPVIAASLREVADRFAELNAAPAPRLELMTERDIALLGFTGPFWNELSENTHMDGKPFFVNDSRTAAVLGVAASPLDTALDPRQSVDTVSSANVPFA